MIIEPLTEARAKIVEEAYKKVESQCQHVSLKDIAKLYNPCKDPQLLNHSMTEGQVFNNFMKNWYTQIPDDHISMSDFLDYYQDISNVMSRDDHFEYLVRSAWGAY